MIEQEPLALILHDAMVCGPAYDGIEDDTLIGEGSVRIVTDGIAEHVAVACGVAEIVLAVVFVHPRSLEETVGIASLQGLTVLVEHHNATGSLSKLQHVVAHLHHEARQRRNIGRRKELGRIQL